MNGKEGRMEGRKEGVLASHGVFFRGVVLPSSAQTFSHSSLACSLNNLNTCFLACLFAFSLSSLASQAVDTTTPLKKDAEGR